MQLPSTWVAIAALGFLGTTLVVGALTAYARLADKNTPVDIGLMHGGTGIVGTLLLLLSAGSETGLNTQPALGILALTIVLGITLYFLIRRKGELPWSVVLLHGTFAVGALATLVFGRSV